MRDPRRIRPFLNEIALIWEQNPDLRFGQLIMNAFSNDIALYYADDERVLNQIKRVYARGSDNDAEIR